MINFIFRKGTKGFPPADPEMLQFMHKQPQKKSLEDTMDSQSSNLPNMPNGFAENRAKNVWNHSIAVGLLQASFEICKLRAHITKLWANSINQISVNEWVERYRSTGLTLEELAEKRHKEMAPLESISYNQDYRPEKRVLFCKAVAARAENIANSLMLTPHWRRIFNDIRSSKIRQGLQENFGSLRGLSNAATKLISNLESFPRKNKSNPLLVCVFDEASSLLSYKDSRIVEAGIYVALNRIISCLKEYSMWFFFLSTESKVEEIVLADDNYGDDNFVNRNSNRFVDDEEDVLTRVPPFLALQLDVEDRYRI